MRHHADLARKQNWQRENCMRVMGVAIGDLEPKHLQALVEARAGESRVLEFKSALPGHSTEAKKEFLADVSAFANTAGGTILFGIETERDGSGRDTGVAKELVGLPGINADSEKQRLVAMLHDGLTPSLAAHVAIRDLEVPNTGGPLIGIGVAQSLARPHMVSFQRSGKFWRRSDSGKYQPDIAELRTMFQEAESWIEDAESFRRARIAVVVEDRDSRRLQPGSCVFIHVLPLGRLKRLMDLSEIGSVLGQQVPPPWHQGWSNRFNADGHLTYTTLHDQHVGMYSQWFRFGGAEGFATGITGERDVGGGRPMPLLWADALVKVVIEYAQAAIDACTGLLQSDPPFGVFVSVLGVAGARIVNPRNGAVRSEAIGPDSLYLPPVVVEHSGTNVATLLEPVFDVLWQSAGYARHPRRGEG